MVATNPKMESPDPKTAADRVLRDPRWAILCARAEDPSFVYSVKTTGVFCRPGCGARRPRPQNVAFHADAQAAIAAGFRPCRRCKPLDAREPGAEALIETARALDSDAEPTKAIHRTVREQFRAAFGLSPRDFAVAGRAERWRDELRHSHPERPTVTQAIYRAGYGAPSRAYEHADAALGMPPAVYRKGGEADLVIRAATLACSAGLLLVGVTERGVCALLLGDDAGALALDLERRFPNAVIDAGDAEFARTAACIVALTDRPELGADLPLDLRGTAFQRRVWQALRKIPAGEVRSYAEVATAIGQPGAARAVARACAANPVAIAVPCHRVVPSGSIGEDGRMDWVKPVGGYRWGVERKVVLLRAERGEG